MRPKEGRFQREEGKAHWGGESCLEVGVGGSGVRGCRYRIVLLNVLGLTIAKALEIKSLIKGDLRGG